MPLDDAVEQAVFWIDAVAAKLSVAREPPGYHELLDGVLAGFQPRLPPGAERSKLFRLIDLRAQAFSAAEGWLTYYERRYAETRNPVFPLIAFGLAVQSRVTVPDWVTRYLSDVSAQVRALCGADLPDGRRAPAVYGAFGFSNVEGDPFREITDTAHDVTIALGVALQLRQGVKLEHAYDEVARTHPAECSRTPQCTTIHRSSVRRCWYAHGPRLEPGYFVK